MKLPKSLNCNSLRFIILLVLGSVSLNSFTAIAQPDPKIVDAYKEALTDSVETELGEIIDNLTIIDESKANPNLYLDTQGRVLVVTFTEYPKFDPSKSDAIWVTVAPKLKSFCTNYKSQNPNIETEELNLRIKQLLGIVPESKKTYIVELWVDPTLLHRPNNLGNVSSSEEKDFLSWLQSEPLKKQMELVQDLQQDKPSSELAKKHYPWTGLGYTFDWASKLDPSIKEAGLSEFVVWGQKPFSKDLVEFNRQFTTEEYCKPDNSL